MHYSEIIATTNFICHRQPRVILCWHLGLKKCQICNGSDLWKEERVTDHLREETAGEVNATGTKDYTCLHFFLTSALWMIWKLYIRSPKTEPKNFNNTAAASGNMVLTGSTSIVLSIKSSNQPKAYTIIKKRINYKVNFAWWSVFKYSRYVKENRVSTESRSSSLPEERKHVVKVKSL